MLRLFQERGHQLTKTHRKMNLKKKIGKIYPVKNQYFS